MPPLLPVLNLVQAWSSLTFTNWMIRASLLRVGTSLTVPVHWRSLLAKTSVTVTNYALALATLGGMSDRITYFWIALPKVAKACRLVTVAMDKLQLAGRNLGRVLNSRGGCLRPVQLCCFETKQPNLMLKTRPKQLLGSLPLDIALPTVVCRWWCH
jgi:hypothetical protein